MANKNRHYDQPIDELYSLFDNGILLEKNSYASFAFCYLKVFEAEKVINKKASLAQFEFEKTKHA